MRRPTRAELRAAAWTVQAAAAARRQSRKAPLAEVRLPDPPANLPVDAGQGVLATLRRVPATCLVDALVRQAWLAAHGDRRDVIVGISGPGADLQAHAWLEGDRDERRGSYSELLRHPAPR